MIRVDIAGGELVVSYDNPEGSRFAIQAVPTLMVMKDGQVVARQAGAAPVAAIRTWVEGALQRSVPA